tara:strand:+ start:417 stop:1163 length:747 start_codon:yes stop_codon:yes gene_type:complete
MAEVMSMLSDENPQGELNSDEQESLAIGEEMVQQQETKLAGKYSNAEELEAAYIELQKKLGSPDTETEVEAPESESDDEAVDTSLFDRLWDESQDEVSEDLLKEIAEADPTDLANMYLDYRNSEETNIITEQDAEILKNSVGGEQAYEQMLSWANDNLEDSIIDMYDSVMESGDRNAAYFAMQVLASSYGESVGVEGKLVQGKAPTETTKGFKSQAEVVNAMQDPRYDRDPAYRQEIMAKLERSNVNF